jgi:hypothetical protein
MRVPRFAIATAVYIDKCLCNALEQSIGFTTVVVVDDGTALSFCDVSLFPFNIRARLPVGTVTVPLTLLDLLRVFSFGPGDGFDQSIQPDTPSQWSETRELHLTYHPHSCRRIFS